MKYIAYLLTLLGLMLVTNPLQAAYLNGSDNPRVTTQVDDDAFVAGDEVAIKAPILGELFAAGDEVTITERIHRSVFAAGNSLTLEQGAHYNAWLAGNDISLAGEYGHDVYILANTVTIEEGTVIRGDLRLAAATATINGTVDGDITVEADKLTSSAAVGGNYTIEATELRFTNGSVGKDLSYRTDKALVGLDSVKVSGQTNELDESAGRRKDLGAEYRGWFFSLLGTLLLGAALTLFLPRQTEGVTTLMAEQWGRSWLTGILFLVLGLLVIILLLISVIGIPLALALLFTGLAFLILTPVYAAMTVGRQLLRRLGDATPNDWAALLVGAILVAGLRSLPVVGPSLTVLILLTLYLPALGAMLLWYRQLQSR